MEHKKHEWIMAKIVHMNATKSLKIDIKPKNLLHMDFLVAVPAGIKVYIYLESLEATQGYLVQLQPKKVQTFAKIPSLENSNVKCLNLEHIIFYGTMFSHVISIEDVYQDFQSMHISWKQKLSILHSLFTSNAFQIKDNQFICGLPVMALNMSALNYAIKQLPYTIQEIQFKKYNQTNHYYYIPYKYPTTTATLELQREFWVRAEITPDIYSLYAYPPSNLNQKPVHANVALVPTYQASVMLNSLFRKIKENQQLDALEESDDEEEFQNTSYSKYVHVNKLVKMNCVYCSKFKKWIPICVV